MVVDSSRPQTIGSLREKVSELPRRNSQSEITPPSTPPMKPQTAGSEAMKPALRMVMPRSCTRYTGNQVRKK
ncbi:hypothetical protein D3C75_804920 [compost metagenome]